MVLPRDQYWAQFYLFINDLNKGIECTLSKFVMIQNWREGLIHLQAVWPFSRTLIGWRVGCGETQ